MYYDEDDDDECIYYFDPMASIERRQLDWK